MQAKAAFHIFAMKNATGVNDSHADTGHTNIHKK